MLTVLEATVKSKAVAHRGLDVVDDVASIVRVLLKQRTNSRYLRHRKCQRNTLHDTYDTNILGVEK